MAMVTGCYGLGWLGKMRRRKRGVCGSRGQMRVMRGRVMGMSRTRVIRMRTIVVIFKTGQNGI
jgi:hypothetical protein